jgi:hypothetical protein
MSARARLQRWLGWCALLLGCAEDNDGCSEVVDCPPPCLVGTIEIAFVPEPEVGVPLPGSGTWIFDVDADGRRFGCHVRPGEIDCTPRANLFGRDLMIDHGPSSFELTVRYVDLDGVESVLVREVLEPEYALPSNDPICGMCPVADFEIVLPVEAFAPEGG